MVNDVDIKFQNFQPTEDTRDLVNEKMGQLRELAPFGSTLKAIFTRKDNAFKGILFIYSKAGRFFARATDHKIADVARKLMEQMRRRLDKWKTLRFQSRHSRPKEQTHDVA